MTRRYAGLATIGGAAAAYILLARPRHLRWGTTDQDSDAPLPGDDLIRAPTSPQPARSPFAPRPTRSGRGLPSWGKGEADSTATTLSRTS
jgi:hypothetical protein